MTPAGLAVVLALAVGSPETGFAGASDGDVLTAAERAFAEGTARRDNAAAARGWFREAANGYDELWRRGFRNPALARNRARAHRLAGDLPGAIAALHQGLAVARYDRPLQVELEGARSAVAYPIDGDLAAQCRPPPARTVGTRMSPAEAYLVAGLLWLLVCGGVARFAMTRARWWLVFAGGWAAGLAVLGGLWWSDHRAQARGGARPLVIVADDATLRRGNAESYPPRLEPKLPRGVEARELTRRGGWVQVELAGGAVGWLPEAAVMPGREPGSPPAPRAGEPAPRGAGEPRA
jgi:hypothetical protein